MVCVTLDLWQTWFTEQTCGLGSETEFFIDSRSEGPKPSRHHQTDAEKMSSILNLLTKFRWLIGRFLWLLFDETSSLGGSSVKSFLNGTSDVHAAHIINAMYMLRAERSPVYASRKGNLGRQRRLINLTRKWTTLGKGGQLRW